MFEKLLSGRWILTLVAGAVFIFCAVTGTLTGEVGTIVAMVFTLYFTRQDRGQVAKK